MDYLRKIKVLTPTQTVKLSQVLSMVTLSVCFFGLAYGVDCSTHGLALFFLCTIGAAFGLCISGFLTSLLSLSPHFIGVLTSTSQIIGFGGRLATPQIITFFKTGTAEEWRGILLVYSAMTVCNRLLACSSFGLGRCTTMGFLQSQSTWFQGTGDRPIGKR
ncbi:hypothetical protein COOONC_13177 [Cooperia oncophora]